MPSLSPLSNTSNAFAVILASLHFGFSGGSDFSKEAVEARKKQEFAEVSCCFALLSPNDHFSVNLTSFLQRHEVRNSGMSTRKPEVSLVWISDDPRC